MENGRSMPGAELTATLCVLVSPLSPYPLALSPSTKLLECPCELGHRVSLETTSFDQPLHKQLGPTSIVDAEEKKTRADQLQSCASRVVSQGAQRLQRVYSAQAICRSQAACCVPLDGVPSAWCRCGDRMRCGAW
jgi:hypothetical protein